MSLSYCFMKALLFTFVTLTLVNSRSYNTGLIFYDLKSLRAYLPPTVSVLRGRAINNVQYSEQGSIWSTFGKPCECKGLICGCCAGLSVKQFNFDQKMCANVTYAPQRHQLLLEVLFDEKSTSKYGISTRNPSPLCIPIMMGIPMAMCVQMSDIAIKGNNLNMCMDFVVRLATTDLFEMHFQCMRMGLDGIQYLDKDGKPVIPSGNIKTEDEYYDDETAIDVLPVQNYNDTNDSAYDNEIDIDDEKEEEEDNVVKPLKKTQTNLENELSKQDQLNTFEIKEEETEENGSTQEENEDEAENENEDDVENMVEDVDDNVKKIVNNDEIVASEEETEESFENYAEDEKKDDTDVDAITENNSNAVAETHEIPRPMTITSISEEVKGATTELNDLEITSSNEVNPVMTEINTNDSKSEVIEVITASTTETSELEMTTTFNNAQPAMLSGYHSNDSQVSVTSSIPSTAENVHKLAVNNSPTHYAAQQISNDTDSLSDVRETQKVKERRSVASSQHKTVPEVNSITFYKRLLGII